jgi:hypothetical protein
MRVRSVAPQKTTLDVKNWEHKKGFRGILCTNTVRRLCEVCNRRPTRTLEEPVCPNCCTNKDHVPIAKVKMCTVPMCHRAAHHAKGTLCVFCWVEEDPVTRGCPGCQRRAKCLSRVDGLCQECTRRIDRGGTPVVRAAYGVSDLFV